MVRFEILEFLTPTILHLRASVLDMEYYENVYLDKVIIDTEDTVKDTGPSSNPPFTYSIGGGKAVDLALDINSLVKDGPKMLFVYVICSGTPSSSTPCGMDEMFSMEAVVDYTDIYNYALKLLKNNGGCRCSSGDCEIDVTFANFALQYFRLEEGLKLGEYESAYDAYCYLLRKSKSAKNVKFKKNCGCNG